jgi:AraC-like DNA-binding protein
MVFEYTKFDVRHMLEKLSTMVGTTVEGDILRYPSHFGEGYLKAVQLPSNIDFIIFEYNYFTDLFVQHYANTEEQYLLWFDISHSLKPLILNIDKETKQFENEVNMSAALLCSHFGFSHLRTKGSNGYGIAIFLHKKILQNFIMQDDWLNVLQWFLDIKLQHLDLIKITEAERTIIADIVNKAYKDFPYITLEKKVHQLLEIFFLRLDKLHKEHTGTSRLLEEEVNVLRNLEQMVDEHCMQEDIDIGKLEKEIGMTKYNLEKLVKKAFHKTLSDYINQYKMQKAYQELVNTKKDIKEIAYEIGYANPSNFSNAFKKRFGHNPSDIR